MPELKEILLTTECRPRVIDDCVQLIDDEVRGKKGLAAIPVKGAYGLVKKIKPGIIREAVDRLLDDFVAQLEPFHGSYVDEQATDFAAYLSARESEVANALLGVTDRRIGNADKKAIRKAYEKLRPTGEKHVRAAVPGVGRVMAGYL